jgi:hypothetical protein
MDLIRSLLKLRGFGLNFLKIKKLICLFLILKIINLLYVRYISGIKRSECNKYVLSLD